MGFGAHHPSRFLNSASTLPNETVSEATRPTSTIGMFERKRQEEALTADCALVADNGQIRGTSIRPLPDQELPESGHLDAWTPELQTLRLKPARILLLGTCSAYQTGSRFSALQCFRGKWHANPGATTLLTPELEASASFTARGARSRIRSDAASPDHHASGSH